MSTRPPRLAGYEYIDTIAESRSSAVFRYRQRRPVRDVAIKVLVDTGLGEALNSRLAGEADAIGELEYDRRVVQIFATDTTSDGRYYIVMPYHRGPHLNELMDRGRLDARKVLRLGVEMAGAVDAVHAKSLLHADIKPANILLVPGGALLTDFGLAGRLGPDRVAEVIGMSLPWSPPEIAAGATGATTASDVYSLGATLWHLLAGRSPFDVPGDNSAEAIKRRIVAGTVPRIGRTDLPADFEPLLAEMMARSPSTRPTARDTAERLARIEARAAGPAADNVPWLLAATPPVERRDPVDRPDETPTILRRAARPDPPVPAGGTVHNARPRLSTAGATAETEVRARDDTPDEASGDGGTPGRGRWWLAGIALAALVTVAVTVGVVTTGRARPSPAPTVDTGDTPVVVDSNNGVPPGVPAVTVARVNSKTLRFRWTYSGQVPSDSYQWQTADGTRHGIARDPSVDLADPAGTQLCVQVKVIRRSGANAALDWSPVGCGD